MVLSAGDASCEVVGSAANGMLDPKYGVPKSTEIDAQVLTDSNGLANLILPAVVIGHGQLTLTVSLKSSGQSTLVTRATLVSLSARSQIAFSK